MQEYYAFREISNQRHGFPEPIGPFESENEAVQAGEDWIDFLTESERKFAAYSVDRL